MYAELRNEKKNCLQVNRSGPIYYNIRSEILTDRGCFSVFKLDCTYSGYV